MRATHSLTSACLILAAMAWAMPASAQWGSTILPSGAFKPVQPNPPRDMRPGAPGGVEPAQPLAQPGAKPGSEQVTVSQAPEPTFEDNSFQHTQRALAVYRDIAARGGWASVLPLPPNMRVGIGTQGPFVATLRQRLVIGGDLAASERQGDLFDATVEAALRRFQHRHGLTTTGTVGPLTWKALNVPAAARVRQLEASLARLSHHDFVFSQRYVAVNIPAAAVEAVDNGRVVHRYPAVVGRPDRATPEVVTRITAVNLNPTWTPPLSIVKNELLPKLRRDPNALARMNMRLLDASGREIAPTSVNFDGPVNYSIRQDPGVSNALGFVRIDMPNPHSVYMHDTPRRDLFASDYRFHSHGCVRVGGVRDLAAWLLSDTPGWSRAQIDAVIASGKRQDVRLPQTVPVVWVYLTGWGTRDGTVHFRDDVYDLDDDQRPDPAMQMAMRASATPMSGFRLQSADKPTLVLKASENRLDDR